MFMGSELLRCESFVSFTEPPPLTLLPPPLAECAPAGVVVFRGASVV
jgi:hypothetical protein